MMSPVYTILWPLVASLFLLSAIICFVAKRWAFGIGLLIPGILLLGSWQYDRAHEKIKKMNVLLQNNTQVKENQKHPGESIFHVSVTALEWGSWEGKLRARDIHLTESSDVVTVEIAERPLTGSYLKSMVSLNYGKPPPKYSYVPPAKGLEFEWAFRQPPPEGVNMLHVLSEWDKRQARIGLAFRTDRATFDKIRPANLEQIPLKFFTFNTSARQEAAWWRLAVWGTEIWGHNVRDGKSYESNKKDHFDIDRTMMTWDADGLVQYLWTGREPRTNR